METIKRQVKDEFQDEFGENAATEVETVENKDTPENKDMVENEVESVAEEIVNVEEVNNNRQCWWHKAQSEWWTSKDCWRTKWNVGRKNKWWHYA